MSKHKKQRQVPVFGVREPWRTNTRSQGSLDNLGSREFGGPPLEVKEGWAETLKHLPDHDVVLRQVTRYIVMFHHGPPPTPPSSTHGDMSTSAGTIERAKERGDLFLQYAPAYVLDVLTGNTYPVWGEKAAQGPKVPRPRDGERGRIGGGKRKNVVLGDK